jgi:hypothetical protein
VCHVWYRVTTKHQLMPHTCRAILKIRQFILFVHGVHSADSRCIPNKPVYYHCALGCGPPRFRIQRSPRRPCTSFLHPLTYSHLTSETTPIRLRAQRTTWQGALWKHFCCTEMERPVCRRYRACGVK